MTTRADQNDAGGELGQTIQVPLTATQLGLTAQVPGTGTLTGTLMQANGYQRVSAAVTSSQAGTLKIQLFLDAAGLIPQGAATSVILTAATSNVVNIPSGTPFQSFQVIVTNSSGTAANLTNVLGLLQSN